MGMVKTKRIFKMKMGDDEENFDNVSWVVGEGETTGWDRADWSLEEVEEKMVEGFEKGGRKLTGKG